MLAMSTLGAAAAAAVTTITDPVRSLAGRYSSHFRNALVSGESFWSDDVAEWRAGTPVR